MWDKGYCSFILNVLFVLLHCCVTWQLCSSGIFQVSSLFPVLPPGVCLPNFIRLCWTFFSLWSWYFWFLDVFVSGEGDKRIPHHKHSTVHFFIFWFQGVRLSCNFWSVLKQYCSSPGFLIVSKFFFGFWLLFYSLSVQSSDHLWREVSFVKPLNFDLLVIQA